MDISRRFVTTAALGGAAAATALAVGTREAAAQASGDSTFDRVKSTKVLRVAALPGESPYFNKNIATGEWTGMAVEMAKNIASAFDAKVEYLESTYGNSVLDLQAGKIDLAFALNPTPQRAMVIGFSRPVFMHGFGTVGKKGFEPKTWADLDKPDVRIAVDIGSVHEVAARNFASKGQITGYKTRDECILAVQSGRADCSILAVILGLTAVKKNPALGKYVVLRDPLVQLPNCMGVRYEVDKRWRDFLDNWADYNRGAAQIRKWMVDGLALNGVMPEDIPGEVAF
jgi:polar amino acid transport system substrate-binding protein